MARHDKDETAILSEMRRVKTQMEETRTRRIEEVVVAAQLLGARISSSQYMHDGDVQIILSLQDYDAVTANLRKQKVEGGE